MPRVGAVRELVVREPEFVGRRAWVRPVGWGGREIGGRGCSTGLLLVRNCQNESWKNFTY